MKRLISLMLMLCSVMAACDIVHNCGQGQNGNLTLFVQNMTDNLYITGATCSVDIYNTYYTQITSDGPMTEEGYGLYNYELQGPETSSIGKYKVVYNCTKDAYTSYSAGGYEVVVMVPIDSLTDILTLDTEMNTTSHEVNTTAYRIEGKVDALNVTNSISFSEINQTISYWNTTLFPSWNTTFDFWNNTAFPVWDYKLNETWYNIVTPASDFILNLFDYFDGRLTTTISTEDKTDIAQKTWNDTIVEDRTAGTQPGPIWQGWGYGFG